MPRLYFLACNGYNWRNSCSCSQCNMLGALRFVTAHCGELPCIITTIQIIAGLFIVINSRVPCMKKVTQVTRFVRFMVEFYSHYCSITSYYWSYRIAEIISLKAKIGLLSCKNRVCSNLAVRIFKLERVFPKITKGNSLLLARNPSIDLELYHHLCSVAKGLYGPRGWHWSLRRTLFFNATLNFLLRQILNLRVCFSCVLGICTMYMYYVLIL